MKSFLSNIVPRVYMSQPYGFRSGCPPHEGELANSTFPVLVQKSRSSCQEFTSKIKIYLISQGKELGLRDPLDGLC